MGPTATLERYALAWHQEHGCRVRVKAHNGPWSPWTKVSAEELTALAAVFREEPVHLENGWVRTGPEPIGDLDE